MNPLGVLTRRDSLRIVVCLGWLTTDIEQKKKPRLLLPFPELDGTLKIQSFAYYRYTKGQDRSSLRAVTDADNYSMMYYPTASFIQEKQ